MSKFLIFLVALTSFFLGYLTSSAALFSDQNSGLNQTNSNKVEDPSQDIVTNLNQVDSSNMIQFSQNHKNKIFEILEALPDSKIDSYLTQLFPEQNFDGIDNKKKFSERLVEELDRDYDEAEVLSGKVTISMSADQPYQSATLNQIHEQQYLYAHLDTYGKVPPNTQVFVKWINLDTQEIILFTPKYIVENSQHNWVSAIPTKGWKTGRYAVQFYQMTDTLTPIAQSSYTIHSIIN